MNPPGPTRASRGFTVLELVIVLAVVATLVVLAIPAYQGYARRADRAEAVRQLLSAAACQERIRAGTGFFDTTRCLPERRGDAYRFRFEPADVTQSLAYTVLAEPLQPPAVDACGTLSLDQAGTRGTSGDAARMDSCWGGR